MAERIEADVCVVGAGYAGLTTARRVQAAGQDVVVLEARDRVGGRIWTDHLADGTPVDRGGGWLAPYHDAILALAGEVGVSTYKTHIAGKHLLVDGDRIRRYTGLIPKISPLAVLTLGVAQLRIDRMAKRVPLEAPWEAERASQWDAQTVAQHLARSGIRTRIGRDLFESAVRGLMTGPLEETSLLHLLYLAHAHHSISKLFSIEKGSQENLVEGGAGEVARRVAASLGDALRLHSPVRSISQQADGVVVEADGATVAARRVVVTIPPALVPDIAFDPVLPADRAELYRLATAGHETKTLVVYDEPFWRTDGFSGQTAAPESVSEVTIDASPADGRRGVLASFTFGRVAQRVDALDPTERRKAVLNALAARLGPRAASPDDFIETRWFEEEWTRGCSMAHLPPGALTRHGRLLREPFGLVHWAGTETATVSHGAIDGAVRSGERARPRRCSPHEAPWTAQGRVLDPGVPAGQPGTPMALTDRDRAILDFERTWWTEPGPKDTAIRERFELSGTRYYQLLTELLDEPEALAYDPLLVRRLRRARDRRRRARVEGRPVSQLDGR